MSRREPFQTTGPVQAPVNPDDPPTRGQLWALRQAGVSITPATKGKAQALLDQLKKRP